MANRFNPFVSMRQTVFQQPVQSAISALPVYAQRLIYSVWNDRNALGLLYAMWNSAIGDVLRDTRQRDPNTVARMLQVSNEISQRLAALPIVESDERWNDYAF